MNNDRFDRTGHVKDSKTGMIIAGLVAAAIIIALVIWMPWSKDHTASNAPAGTTTGQGATPQAKSPPSPAAPATNR